MNTVANSMESIAVLFCKHFPEVVRKARLKEPLFLETSHSILKGVLHPSDNKAGAGMSKESWQFIEAMAANGYTVTAYVRLSDFNSLIPFGDEFEAFTANAVNEKILGKLFPKAQSN